MPTGKNSYSCALARFATLEKVFRAMSLNYRAVQKFVAYQNSQVPGEWAPTLLEKMQGEDAEAELPALAEFFDCAGNYVHKDEGQNASKSNLLEAYADYLSMGEEMECMFGGPSGGHPGCTSAGYTRGYYQIMKKQMLSLGEEFSYREPDGTVLYNRQKKSPAEEALSIARVMKKMQHVVRVFMEACKVDLVMARVFMIFPACPRGCFGDVHGGFTTMHISRTAFG